MNTNDPIEGEFWEMFRYYAGEHQIYLAITKLHDCWRVVTAAQVGINSGIYN